MRGANSDNESWVSLATRWVRLSEIAAKGVDQYMCCRCQEFDDFGNMWSAIPFSKAGKQMLQGYIHCGSCRRNIDAMHAWKQAHDREYR